MDAVAKRRGGEWIKSIAALLIKSDLECPEDLEGVDPCKLTGADTVPEIKMAALCRVIEKSQECVNLSK